MTARLWPDGTYTLTATGARRQSASPRDLDAGAGARSIRSISAQNPPLLSINGQNYTMNQIQKIVRSGL